MLRLEGFVLFDDVLNSDYEGDKLSWREIWSTLVWWSELFLKRLGERSFGDTTVDESLIAPRNTFDL